MTTPRTGGYNDEDASVAAEPDPTTPLGDGTGAIDSALTGSGSGAASGPLFNTAQQKIDGLQSTKGAPRQTDYTDTYHHLSEKDWQQNQRFAKDAKDGKFDFRDLGGVSHNDLDRIRFGVEEPAKLSAARQADKTGKAQLEKLASTINGGDIDAVGKADDILKQGEAGLRFFEFFAPAYNAWKGGGITYAAAKHAYEAEYGLSFADYSTDSKTLVDLAQQLTTIQNGLETSYNTLVPTWSGQAASNFYAKMAVFFKAAGTVSADVSTVGRDIAALVGGLQQLILAKAQTVSELYADTLPNGIDGVMASTLVRVAQGNADEKTCLTAFRLLGGVYFDFSNLFGDNLFDFTDLKIALRAVSMAQQWCNKVLVPQFEGREQALNSVNSETTQRIAHAFAAFTGQVQSVHDPFTGMASATGPKTGSGDKGTAPSTPVGGGGTPPITTGGGGGGGGSTPTGITTPTGMTTPSGITSPTGFPTGTSTPTPTTTPTGIPLPTGVTPPTGTGPTGTDPTGTTLPGTTPTGSTLPGTTPTGTDRIVHHKDGSVSLGSGVTISPESGKHGTFRLTSTDPDGTHHTYRVHFDRHGDPVVTEVHPSGGGFDGTSPQGIFVDSPLNLGTDGTGAGGADVGPAGFGAGASIGGGGAGIGGGSIAGDSGSGVGSGLGSGDIGSSGHVAAHTGDNLSAGAQVGADNTMSTAGAPESATAPAGSAASAAAPGGEHGGGFGAMPMTGAMGRGAGGGDQESARKYQQRGDVVGEDDVEEWQRMGPVIGEQ